MKLASKDFRRLWQAAQIADAQRELMRAQPRLTIAHIRQSGMGLIAATLTFLDSLYSWLYWPRLTFQFPRLAVRV